MKVSILGVQFDQVTRAQAHQRVREFLSDGNQHYIVTPNPEMLVKAQHDVWFHRILNAADLSVADGVGVMIAARIFGGPLRERIRGIDLLDDILAIAAQQGTRVFLLGSQSQETIEKAARELTRRHVGLRIVGAHVGPYFNEPTIQGSTAQESMMQGLAKFEMAMDLTQFEGSSFAQIITQINRARPEVLIVAFGHGKQEKWIDTFLHHVPSVRIAIGVGGALDVIGGRLRRAPSIVRQIGLEWMWRFLQEPWRLKRIFNATVGFLWHVILWRMRQLSRS